MIYIDSKYTAETGAKFDEAGFLADLTARIDKELDDCEFHLEPWKSVLVCHWSACRRNGAFFVRAWGVPTPEEMPLPYQRALNWFRSQDSIEYRVVHLRDRSRIEVKLCHDRFMASFKRKFDSHLSFAREHGKKEFNPLVLEWGLCLRSLWQRINGEAPQEETMPEHARWVMNWLHAQNFKFEIARCGGFQFRPTNWGIFVEV